MSRRGRSSGLNDTVEAGPRPRPAAL